MEKSSSQIFREKVKLIYEYNKESPLFVRAAYFEIQNNNFDDAIFILRQGLKLYPENPVAIFLLARANALMGPDPQRMVSPATRFASEPESLRLPRISKSPTREPATPPWPCMSSMKVSANMTLASSNPCEMRCEVAFANSRDEKSQYNS